MRFRIGGLVLEIEKKGLIAISLLSLVLLGLIVYTAGYAGSAVFNKAYKYGDELEVEDLDRVLGRRKKNDKTASDLEEPSSKDYDDAINKKDGNDDVNYNGKKDALRIGKGDTFGAIAHVDKEESSFEIDAHQPQNKRNIKMAMETISSRARQGMARAAKAMSLPHRPPDSHYSINVTLSDQTSLDRDLPDTRPPVCATLKYDISTLSKVSVIIPFYNEAPTMLLRNIHSILNRSPNELLEEIILVDDLSYDAPLMQPLEKFIKNVPRISLLRNDKRSGLIVSRMRGARVAKAPVIIFLDAHSEVNVGWLEPLLEELRKNPKQVLQPFIDGIDNRNLEFSGPTYFFKGTFSWDLRYTWTKIADHEQKRAEETGEPFFTPTIVGCAIAVVKDYFFDIGSFDEGMYVWGGENIELAFRTWMCGGKATTVTCSRVGHVFKQSPNKFDGTKGTKEETIQKNLIRVADVWMDGMRKFFYATTLMYSFKRFKLNQEEIRTLKERTKLRKRLKCHSFEWYLYNVFPEMLYLPPQDSNYFGEIMNLQSRACWEVTDDYYIGLTYFCFEHKIIPKNNFALMKNGLMMYRDKCVKINPPSPHLTLAECPPDEDIERFGIWELDSRGVTWGSVRAKRLNDEGAMVYWCVVQVTNAMPEHKGDQMPQLGSCNPNDGFQTWSFTYAVDFTLVPEYMSVYQQELD